MEALIINHISNQLNLHIKLVSNQISYLIIIFIQDTFINYIFSTKVSDYAISNMFHG
jgi:hypothetical protein